MKLRHLDSSPPNVGKLDVCSDANDRASMAASTGIGGVATGVGVGVGNANGVDGGVTGGVGLGVAVAAGVDARAASELLHAISSATVAHRIARIRNLIKKKRCDIGNIMKVMNVINELPILAVVVTIVARLPNLTRRTVTTAV